MSCWWGHWPSPVSAIKPLNWSFSNAFLGQSVDKLIADKIINRPVIGGERVIKSISHSDNTSWSTELVIGSVCLQDPPHVSVLFPRAIFGGQYDNVKQGRYKENRRIGLELVDHETFSCLPSDLDAGERRYPRGPCSGVHRPHRERI
jgi:hypothetical protein